MVVDVDEIKLRLGTRKRIISIGRKTLRARKILIVPSFDNYVKTKKKYLKISLDI